MIYFDNAATTYPKPECVYEAINYANRNLAFNAGRGQYNSANLAFQTIENTRKLLCEKAKAKYAIFTPSATHAINQIIAGMNFQKGDIVYCSPFDHNAILRTLHAYSEKNEFEIKTIPLTNELLIDLDLLELECIKDKPKAIFCTHVSNVTGYILPIDEISKIAKNIEAILVVDGAQAFGLVDVNMNLSQIDYYIFAGHKTLYGPFGVAGYFINDYNLNCTIFGGTGSDSLNVKMPETGTLKYEPSSPNVVAISGLAVSLDWVFKQNCLNHERFLFEYAVKRLLDIDGIVLYDAKENYTGILSFNLEGYNSEDLALVLNDDFNIAVRGGYHCCALIHEFLNTKKYAGTVRISFSYFNTIEEVDELIEALEEIAYES